MSRHCGGQAAAEKSGKGSVTAGGGIGGVIWGGDGVRKKKYRGRVGWQFYE